MSDERFVLTKDEAMRRARKGAEFLNERKPGWFDEINIDELDLGSPSDCILAQLYGSFSSQIVYLFNAEWPIAFDKAAEYGFAVSDAEFEDDMELCYPMLTAAWVEVINELRNR